MRSGHMVLLLSVAAHRAVEAAHARREPQASLMRRAAQAAFEVARDLCGDGGRVLVVAGPGNNGGDAWVLAERLQHAWFQVTLVANSPPRSPEAMHAAARLAQSGVLPRLDWPEDQHDLVVDGLFGIGIKRDPDDWSAALINKMNVSGIPILALDVPSGLNADTGNALNPCVRATKTISFIAGKPGLYTADGPDCVGQPLIDDLGTRDLVESQPAGQLLAAAHPLLMLPPRKKNSHKGTYGSVGIIGGAPGMTGAGILAARAALRAGCGKAFLGLIDDGISWDPLFPEVMVRRARDLVREEELDALVIGTGLGLHDPARNLVAEAFKANIPLVIDADALNLVAQGKALQTQLRRRSAGSVVTPHPAEAARLLSMTTASVLQDRIEAARQLSQHLNSAVVLKGTGSVIAFPDGRWFVNVTGNPGMASGGMGDALSGLLGSLLAQGNDLVHATCLGIWLHGQAADQCVATGLGPAGLLASDVIQQLPRSLRDLAS